MPRLLTVDRTIEQWANGLFKVKGNTISYDGEALPFTLNRRIVAMIAEGQSPKAFFRFWERLQQNPSYRSVKQLWAFLNQTGIPLTPDGCFLTYKSVRRDYKDHHSGNFDNSPGTVLEMSRNQISDDPQVACHEGFHVGALGYVDTFGGGSKRIVVCKVDPKDVVCVPYDESQQKMRVCKYKVIGNHGVELPDHLLDEDGPDGTSITAALPVKMEPGMAPEATTKRRTSWTRYDNMDIVDLMGEDVKALRTYASQGLNIVGAGRIPGGKVNLVQAILQVRYDDA